MNVWAVENMTVNKTVAQINCKVSGHEMLTVKTCYVNRTTSKAKRVNSSQPPKRRLGVSICNGKPLTEIVRR